MDRYLEPSAKFCESDCIILVDSYKNCAIIAVNLI